MNLLKGLIEELETQNLKAVDGRLRISSTGDYSKYYHCSKNGDKRGKYISIQDQDLIKALAQQRYNEDMLKLALKEYKYLESFINKYPQKTFDEYYDSLIYARQKMINPIWLPDDEFKKRWLSQEYKRLEFSPYDMSEFITDAGIRVRSKSEVVIANTLGKYELPYLVESPLYLEGLGWVFPDFTVLDMRTRRIKIWEHHGMLDDGDYREKNFLKKNAAYLANGFFPGDNLIQTFESKKTPLSVKTVEDIINKMFFM